MRNLHTHAATTLLNNSLVYIKILIVSAIMGLALLTARPSAGQTIAVGELAAPVDLSKAGKITARITRLAVENAEGAIDKFLHGNVLITEGSDGEPDVNVEWSGISTDSGGAGAVALGPALESAHEVTETTIPGGAEMQVSGDVSALLRALQTLAQNAVEPVVAEEPSSEGESFSTGGSSTQAGSGASIDTSEAKLPEIQAVTETEQVETIVNADVYGTTREGCTPEMSEDGTKMHILERPTKNGVADGECQPGIETASIEATYVGCGYETDLTALPPKAYATKSRYYVFGGTAVPVSNGCERDEETTFNIFETAEGCNIVPDLRPGILKAKQYTALRYVGRENEPVDVEGCKARTGEEFPIKLTLCGLRDDFEGGKTYEQEGASYVGSDGLRRNIGDCSDTTRFYVHEQDTTVCNPLADFSTNKLYQQYRIKINIPRGLGYDPHRTNTCQPFTEALTDLVETQAGCESLKFDYDGYSLGAKRIVRTDNGAQIRECREANIRMDHYYEPEGWLPDDQNLKAKPKTAAYVNLPAPAGKTLVSAAVVRPGAAEQAYTLSSTTYENGTYEYVGQSCNRYLKQVKIEHWRRPDGSIMTRQNGYGPSIGPENACTFSFSPVWTKKSAVYSSKTYTCGEGRVALWTSATYEGSRTQRRADGVTVSTETKTASWSNCHSHCSHNDLVYRGSGYCPATVADGTSQAISLRATVGW